MTTAPRTRWQRWAAFLVGASVVLAACGGADGASTTGAGVRDEAGSAATTSVERELTVRDELSDADEDGAIGSTETTTPAAKAEAASAADEAESISEPPLAPDATTSSNRVNQEPSLRAGSVDDNADFDDYLAYRNRLASLGIQTRDVDPTGRITVRATGSNGLPLAGAAVAVNGSDGTTVTLRASADGTVRFHPVAHGADPAATFTFTAGNASATTQAGGALELRPSLQGGPVQGVNIDVVFLLDATGSMADEIDRLKATIETVSERLSQLPGDPSVRFGMTTYRDDGDAYLTRGTPLTADVAAFAAALERVQADGGGDYPEALDEGLADALSDSGWRDPANTIQLVFLVADAPPQVKRQVPTPYDVALLDAAGRGIKIHPIASSGTDDQAEAVFRQLAQFTGGRFVFLSYGAGGAEGTATGSATDINPTDYEELSLDDLVVRLVAEEVAALTGDATIVPLPTPQEQPQQ